MSLPRNLQSEWARLLITSLVDAGIQDVVLSPGSRSTPFVAAALALAAEDERQLRLFDVLDERAAAFFALGQARITGRASLLVCTSGSAGANYLPAVVEAAHSRLPLLVLTADRPLELVDCGANQTIDQVGLFGRHARRLFELGAADAAPRALRALRRRAVQAVLASRHPEPGPVHLNARVKKPLEPTDAKNKAERRLRAEVTALLARQPARTAAPRARPDEAALDALAAQCERAERGLIVAGPGPLERAAHAAVVFELARRTGFPLLADATSQFRYRGPRPPRVLYADAASLYLAEPRFRRAQRPEIVVQIGRAPTATAWEQYLGEHPVLEHWLLDEHDWNDPQSTATHLLLGDLGEALSGLVERLERGMPEELEGRRERPWRQAFHAAEAAAQKLLDGELERKKKRVAEGGVARSVARALPAGGLLMVGNSLPIRHLDLFAPGRGEDLLVLHQRGASGIDGVTSGALGAAAAARRPMALLVGDVGFLHDVGGLAAARHVDTPFALVVIQNRGGRIFEMLPMAEHETARGEAFEHWTTPHEADLAHAAKLHGLPFARVTERQELDEALERALGEDGVTLIEAVVPRHGVAKQRRRLREGLWKASVI